MEIWSAQFADMSIDYCQKIKAAAEAVGSRIINIQVDGSGEPVRSGCGEAHRIHCDDQGVDGSGGRCRRADAAAPTRAADPPEAWDVNRTADSFRQLAEYGKKIGVKILVENHIGYSADIDKVVAIAKAVNDPYCRVISDWGNTPSSSPEARVAGLSKLFPYLELVSAKELDFDEQNRHINYDVVPLIKATEASGYKGIYSIEFYGKPPKDTVAAAKDMIKALTANIERKKGSGSVRKVQRSGKMNLRLNPLAFHRNSRTDARSSLTPLRVDDTDSLSPGLAPSGSM